MKKIIRVMRNVFFFVIDLWLFLGNPSRYYSCTSRPRTTFDPKKRSRS